MSERTPTSVKSARLVLKLYVLVVAAIVVSGVVLVSVASLTFGSPEKGFIPPQARYLVSTVAEKRGDPAALKHAAARLAELTHISIALYDADNRLLVEGGKHKLPPLKADQLRRLSNEFEFSHGQPPTHVLALYRGRDKGGYALIKMPPPPFEMHPPMVPPLRARGPLHYARGLLLPVGLFLVVLALVSVLFVRSLARPIAALSQTARAFGAGDWSARSGINRNDELGDLGRAFDDMADRVTGLMRSQTELLANASHELRTPMARIRVALDIANEGDAQLARDQLSEIAEDLAELEQLVGDIMMAAKLDLKKGEARESKTPLRLEDFKGAEFIDDAVERFRRKYTHVELELAVANDLPLVRGDKMMLRRVVENLLDNARKHSGTSVPLRVIARADDEVLIVEVSDRGVGISEENLQKVFEPFFRADRSRTRSTGGVGLGLALCRRIVEAHGGSIEMESEEGVGTTVRFGVPGISDC